MGELVTKNDMLDSMQLETKYYKIEKLLKWEHRDEVDQMLMTNSASPAKVSEWCKEKGFSISKQKLYDYKDMLQRAINKRITVEQLLGIGEARRVPSILAKLGMGGATQLVKNELEVLDTIIQIGFSNVLETRMVDIKDAMKAIELKDKITGGEHAGLTGYGLQQLRELEEAKFTAIVRVVMKYLPEDKLEEIQEAIEVAERQFYEEFAPEYLDDYDMEMRKRLEEGATGDNTIVGHAY